MNKTVKGEGNKYIEMLSNIRKIFLMTIKLRKKRKQEEACD